MLCAIASLPARTNFPVFVDKLAQQVNIFVVDDQFGVSAKAAISGAEITLLSRPPSLKFSHGSYSYRF